MKKIICPALLALAAESALASAAIEQVIVRQQWPWSTDVKVEYRITGVDPAAPVTLGIRCYNGGVPLDSSRLLSATTGNRHGITDGIGELIIDPVKAFGQERIALANFKVKLTVTEDPSMAEVIYRIYDMSDKAASPYPFVDVTRADLLNGRYGAVETSYAALDGSFKTDLEDVLIWTGVTNYPGAKTTHLVLRKIPAKGKTWTMGASGGNLLDNASLPHACTLSRDYFIGVFELTQEQYRRLSRSEYNGSLFKEAENPLETLDFASFVKYVGEKNVMNFGEGLSLGLPTEAQWEFACRAGTASELPTGAWLSMQALHPIAWHGGNSGNKTHAVGGRLPNAFGLYDTIGNVYEACADNASDEKPAGYVDGQPVTDPTGCPTPDADGRLVIRGGFFGVSNFFLTSAGRNRHAGKWEACGFRVCALAD